MILFVDQSGQLGGAELCLADLAVHRRHEARVLLFSDGPFVSYLKTRRVEVEVLPLPGTAARITKKASPLSLLASAPGLLAHISALRKKIRASDLVYFNTAKALVHGAAANFPSLRPSIFHLHDLLDPRHFSGANIRILVAAANRMDTVIANSQASAEAFKASGGRVPVEIVPNGFDPSPFDAVLENDVARLRAELNPENRPVAAIFGRLARWKGQDVLLQAASRLPELAVWIVGDALFTEDDRAYSNELRTLASRLGGRVKFLGFRDDIPLLMKAADMVVHCSIAPEPFGRVIVEAMLAGRPVIAARAGGPIEILADSAAGKLVSPGDAGSLEDALRRLLASPEERLRLGAAGRQRAETEYALPVVMKKTDAVLARFT